MKKTKVVKKGFWILIAFMLVLVGFFTGIGSRSAHAAVIYVKYDALGSNDGTSWNDAYTNFQPALAAANSGDDIWTAKGTYAPGNEVGGSGNRFRTFQLKNGVEVYGGFEGVEDPLTFDLDDRDFEANETILSGAADNVYHVFRHVDLSLDSSAVLDGFTITGGNADGAADPDNKGGGMLNSVSSSANGSSPTIRNCIFKNNSATEGGAMYNSRYSDPDVSHTIFSNNTASEKGGAVFNIRNNPVFSHCTFSNNDVTSSGVNDGGGAIYNTTSVNSEKPTISHCQFYGNTVSATSKGGAVFSYLNPGNISITDSIFNGNEAQYGGALFHNSGSDANRDASDVQISNNTFEENSAEYGGAIFSDRHNSMVASCIIRGNQASEQGGGFYSRFASSQLINSLISGNKSAKHGGGIYLNDDDTGIINTTIAGNYSGERGGGISLVGGSVIAINNSILWGNASPEGNELWVCDTCTANIDYSIYGDDSGDVHIAVGGVVSATNSQNLDPVLLNPYAPTPANTPNILGNYFLCGCTSPAIDAGLNSHVPAGIDKDLRGMDRLLDGNGNGTATVDPGAYEYDPNGCNALAPSYGDGTPGAPYEISMLPHLYWIAVEPSRWDKHYIQTADFDACATATWFGGEGWTPIGNSVTKFTGTYDGQGYRISNLSINRPGSNNIGLFGIIGGVSTQKVVIKNLTLINADIIGNREVGALVGLADQWNTIENCHVSGMVKGMLNTGGLAGWGRRTDFLQCSSSTSVEVEVTGTSLYHGGLIGHINSTSTVKECFATGNVSGRSRVGGLIGAIGWNSVVEDSYARGNVTADLGGLTNPMIGGLIGEVWNAGVRRSYSTGEVDMAGLVSDYGGLVGNKTTDSNFFDENNFWDANNSGLGISELGVGKTTSEMKDMSTFTVASWDFQGEDVNGTNYIWGINSLYNGGYPFLIWKGYPHQPASTACNPVAPGDGDGTDSDPYKVATLSNLCWIAQNSDRWDKHYIQTAHIDASDTSTWDGGAGWLPIGNGDEFTGSYNGDGYKIIGLRIDRPTTNNVGLFGHVGLGAVIQNVRLEDVEVIGARGVGTLIGRVTGNTDTLIYRCYAINGEVIGDGATGGLVGSHNSLTETPGGTNNPVISQCYADIDVYFSGNLSAGKDKFGGLAGCSQKGTIMDSYARGSVTVNDADAERVGGLAGCVVLRGEIIRSYSTGAVTSPGTFVGGLVGRIQIGGAGNNGVVTDSYWDTQTSGQPASAGGFPRNTVQMTTQATFANWDFGAIWAIDSGQNDGYPYLLWEDFVKPDDPDDPDPGEPESPVIPQKRRAMRLDGIIDRVRVEHDTSLVATNALTVEAWVKKSSAQADNIAVVVKDKAYALFLENGNEPAFRVWQNTTETEYTASSGFPLIANRWYHLAGTFDGTAIRIYINGYLHETETLGVITLNDGGYPIGIGADLDPDINNTGWFFHGDIDEVRIWEEERDAGDLRAGMCQKLLGTEVNLVGYWRFDELFGLTCEDDSGNDNIGTIYAGHRICSSAPIGDDSLYDYSGSQESDFTVSLTGGNDDIDVTGEGGDWNENNTLKSGLQVYWVEDAPDDDGRGPLNWKLFRNRGYFGVYITGGIDPTYEITHTYDPAGIGRQENLKLAFRRGNCEPWKDLDATIGSGVITKEELSGTEYILGIEMDPRNAIFYSAGTNDYVQVADNADLDLTDFGAIEAWINITGYQDNAGIICKGDGSGSSYSFYMGSGGANNTINFTVNELVTITSTTTLNLGTWYHVAGTWDDNATNNMTLYINGVAENVATTAAANANNADLYIGYRPVTGSAGNFHGYIDEVRIWNISGTANMRTQTLLRDTMCQKLAGNEADLGGYWRFDEETDSDNCPDYSGNGNDGTMTGFADIRDARRCSSAPIGDDSDWDYYDGVAGNVTVQLFHTDGDSFYVTQNAGNWADTFSGMHVYRLDEPPVYPPDLWDDANYTYQTPNGLSPPNPDWDTGITEDWSSVDYYRYWGVFVTDWIQTPKTYDVIYYYSGNPMVPQDDSNLGLAKRDDYCDREWEDSGATLNTGTQTLTKTGEAGTEYILGGTDEPLAITLASFTAAVSENGCVEIEWETATEIDTLGFYLWRSTQRDGEYEMIPNSYTRSKSLMETMGDRYAFTDCGVDLTSGDRYYYKLEEIEVGLREARHFYGPIGPVSETVGASQQTRDFSSARSSGSSGNISCFIGALME